MSVKNDKSAENSAGKSNDELLGGESSVVALLSQITSSKPALSTAVELLLFSVSLLLLVEDFCRDSELDDPFWLQRPSTVLKY